MIAYVCIIVNQTSSSFGMSTRVSPSTTGTQPGIGKGDRKRRMQGFEVLQAKVDAKINSPDNATASADSGSGMSTGATMTTEADDPSVAAAISAHRGREAVRDKRPRGGLAPSLLGLLWEHQLPAALAAGVALAAKASEQEAASAAAMSRVLGDDTEAWGGGGERRAGGEGPASTAAALVFAAVRQVCEGLEIGLRGFLGGGSIVYCKSCKSC